MRPRREIGWKFRQTVVNKRVCTTVNLKSLFGFHYLGKLTKLNSRIDSEDRYEKDHKRKHSISRMRNGSAPGMEITTRKRLC